MGWVRKLPLGSVVGIGDREGNRLAGRIQQRQRRAAGVAHRGAVFGSGELISVSGQRLRIVLEGRACPTDGWRDSRAPAR